MNPTNANGQNTNSIYNQRNSNIIVTPYERVLSIINSAKQYINLTSKSQSKLVRGLEWTIKIITSHSLYTYELKEKELISELSEKNPEFKQFVNFVSEYNDEVIEMNKKNIIIGAKSFEVVNELLQKPSTKLKRQDNKKDASSQNLENVKTIPKKCPSEDPMTGLKKSVTKKQEILKVKLDLSDKSPQQRKHTKSGKNIRSKGLNNCQNKKNIDISNCITSNTIANDSENFNKRYQKTEKSKRIFPQFQFSSPYINKKRPSEFLKSANTEKSFHKKLNSIAIGSSTLFPFSKKSDQEIHKLSKKKTFTMNSTKLRPYSFIEMEAIMNKANFDTKSITEKEFNIFELEKIVGHKNVLPVMGRVMLDYFGLINDKIIAVNKLDNFLVSITDQYLTTTLYHNSMHGADITQSICLYFINSNAEEVCQTNVLDLLSILISALGHDIGHPGLTNNFHINSSSEMALTYNDISCLENFHLSKLFRTIRKDETNIFEKLSTQDYKTIRKRMISEILATDMANHGKIMTNIQSKIPEALIEQHKNLLNNNSNNENNLKTIKFELITGNEKTKFEEQQALLDFFIHSADLAHNTKLFHISIKWVELLSKEFWLQGDKEKSMNLPVSFLCDRNNTDIPKSQLGFIGGFIIPTFNCLITMFPTLNYTIVNANKNLAEWQKLANAHRKTGWTPPKKSKQSMENGSTNLRNNVKDGKRIKINMNSNNKQHSIQWKPEKVDIKK